MKTFVTQEMLSMWNHSPGKVLEELAQAVFQAAVQESLKMLPVVNENIIKQAAVLHKSANEFYAKNQDLAAHKPFVAKVMDSIEGQNPGISIEELHSKVAKETRERLKLQPALGKKRLDELDNIVGMI